MNVHSPLLCLSKTEAESLLSHFASPHEKIVSRRGYVRVVATKETLLYVMPANNSTKGTWDDDHCTDCVVVYVYYRNMPFNRFVYDLTTGVSAENLLINIMQKSIVPLLEHAPHIIQEVIARGQPICTKISLAI